MMISTFFNLKLKTNIFKINMYEDSMNGPYPSKITENIYQGGFVCSENKDNLKKLGITHILVASLGLAIHFPSEFKYLRIDVVDTSEEDMSKHFNTIYEFVDECINNSGKILIHCAAGISRSTTSTCAYLIKKHKISFDKAWEIVKTGRRYAYPNMGFQDQLRKWAEKCSKIEKMTTIREEKECSGSSLALTKDTYDDKGKSNFNIIKGNDEVNSRLIGSFENKLNFSEKKSGNNSPNSEEKLDKIISKRN